MNTCFVRRVKPTGNEEPEKLVVRSGLSSRKPRAAVAGPGATSTASTIHSTEIPGLLAASCTDLDDVDARLRLGSRRCLLLEGWLAVAPATSAGAGGECEDG